MSNTVPNIVRVRLVADAPVLALTGQRIYVLNIEQDCDMPAISFQHIADEPLYTFDAEETGQNQHWQIDCWSDSYTEAESLANAVETAMAASGTDFNAIRTGRGASYEDANNLYLVSLDFSLWI